MIIVIIIIIISSSSSSSSIMIIINNTIIIFIINMVILLLISIIIKLEGLLAGLCGTVNPAILRERSQLTDLGANYCTPESDTSESSWIFSGIFQWIVSGIFQHNFTCHWYFPKDCHLSSGCLLKCPIDFQRHFPMDVIYIYIYRYIYIYIYIYIYMYIYIYIYIYLLV